jgi:hypothetical protein
MTSLSSALRGDSKALYPNFVMNLSIMVQNCSHFLDANPLTITLTSNNPDVQIIDGEYTGIIAANSIVELLNEFQIQVAPNAATAIATLSFNATANLPIVAGNLFELNVIVNPSGTLVWDGIENGQDYSGEFIKNYLTSALYPAIYTTEDILSYVGMDALFLSFGNYGTGTGTNTVLNADQAAKVQEYLESGGNVYLEGGDALGYDQVSNIPLLNLFGLSSAIDGSTNLINNLQGQAGTLTEGINFTSSTQVNNGYIDKYFINSSGLVSFIEVPYGNVGVQSTGSFGQKTFCFSYALAELVDGNPPSTRDTLLQRILDFFDVVVPVELTSFTATLNGKEVVLNWSTATELNNQGFEIERSEDNISFNKIGFVPGFGTTTEPKSYSYSDRSVNTGTNYYRLKQVDYDGSFEYSNVVEVEINTPTEFMLAQNFPNPFNPTTTIDFGIKEKSNVKIIILNAIGEEVAVVLNEEREPGFHQVEFSAANLPSGVYFYQLKAGSFIETKKMLLLK